MYSSTCLAMLSSILRPTSLLRFGAASSMTNSRSLVVDRGVGVPPEDLDRVFDKFYRVAELGSSNGLGLGLAICKAFIEAHHGRISLENNPMGGTIVRFVIPA